MTNLAKRRRYGLKLVLGALLFLPSLTFAQTSVIEGYVRDRQGKPMPNVTVTLRGSAGMQVDRTQTDQEGHYRFFSIGAGTYTINVELQGLAVEQRRVEFETSEEGHRREDFVLESALETRPSFPNEPAFVQKVPPEAERSFQRAQDLLRTGKTTDGVRALHEAVKLFPDYFAAWNTLGMEYLKQTDAAKAGPAFQRAVAVNKNSASARFGLGWAYYQAEKLEDAARELSESAKLNPRLAETHWYLGMTQLERKQWAEAEQAFVDFKKLNPRSGRPMLHLYLTSVYDALGRPADAVQSLETYLREVPEKDRTQKLKDLLTQLKRKAH